MAEDAERMQKLKEKYAQLKQALGAQLLQPVRMTGVEDGGLSINEASTKHLTIQCIDQFAIWKVVNRRIQPTNIN